MPGLINRTTSTILPLAASEVTSCVSGYAFGMTACLSYHNSENRPFEGLFVYPLDEHTTVVGFEAVVSERVLTVQIKDKARTEESCFAGGRALEEEGDIVLDEDLERIVFVANVGIVPPQVDVSICISTSSELQTLPTGAVRVLLPAVCAPRVSQKATNLTTSFSGHSLPFRDRRSSGTLSPEQAGKFCLAHLLENETTNPVEYEFSFSLEIRGPCLLAGQLGDRKEGRLAKEVGIRGRPCSKNVSWTFRTLARVDPLTLVSTHAHRSRPSVLRVKICRSPSGFRERESCPRC